MVNGELAGVLVRMEAQTGGVERGFGLQNIIRANRAGDMDLSLSGGVRGPARE